MAGNKLKVNKDKEDRVFWGGKNIIKIKSAIL